MSSQTILRAATHRLTATPVNELPPIAAYLAASISDCGSILSAPLSQKKASQEADTLLVLKLKARITSLLQDKTVEGRWTAVILVKATIEAGQWEILRGCEPWVHSLLTILTRPDPATTKRLCIITLTRIFRLTYAYPTLVREITTPSLPSFITNCLNLVSVKPSSEPVRKLKQNAVLLESVFCALLELLPHHPTIFRPFSAQIHSLILPLIALTTSAPVSQSVSELARQLFIHLHHCAPKNTGSDEWRKALRYTLTAAHQTCDHLFRAVVEQWESADPSLKQRSRPGDYSQPVGDNGTDSLGLPAWRGVFSGSERLVGLLRLISGFISMRTNSSMWIPIGSILDLTSRLTSITTPSSSSDDSIPGGQMNPEVGRKERECLFGELPRIHAATLNLLQSFTTVLGPSSIPIGQTCLDQALWVFEAEGFLAEVRTATYDLIDAVLPIIGPSMTKAGISALSPAFKAACQELLPSKSNASEAGQKTSRPNPAANNVDNFLNPASKAPSPELLVPTPSSLRTSASRLLPDILNFLPTEHIPPALRAEIDRTAILTGHEPTMVSSVLNPIPASTKAHLTNSSIMPFLARAHASSAAVEGLLRPRMPVLMGASKPNNLTFDEDEDEEEEDQIATAPAINGAIGGGNLFIHHPATRPAADEEEEQEETTSRRENKRSYQDEEMTGIIPVPMQSTTTSISETKRVRVELDQQKPTQPWTQFKEPSSSLLGGALSQPVSTTTAQPVSSLGGVTKMDVESSVVAQVTGPSATAAAVGGAGSDDGSDDDDEIPTLNIESDTDTDDEMVG
ncbi:hypothetical protein AJ80_02501 [Polytolypa hystricis UAMH7299]|uniref:Pre-rRNA-processing protein RIX1 n=1 Tax=Polytolypa hystricis (strain UAMH7299) TaxID=1447883 RepID=A0A2B7YQR3_POLH7|nr:hypothetical protein AJ80_02501 [Polytolypa hystricis UAMH7299]